MRKHIRTFFTSLFAVAASLSCSGSSSGPDDSLELTGFWSGRTIYDSGGSCDMLSCYVDSRMMIVQSGKTVSGWYRYHANIESTQSAFTGSIQGDTLSLLVNSNQISWTGPMKFSVSSNGRTIVARQDKKTISLTLEQ